MSETYQYKVRDKSGNLVTGTLVADNERWSSSVSARWATRRSRSARRRRASTSRSTSRPQKVKLKDVAVFSRQFATMVNSGLPILRALSILAEQAENKALAEDR